MDIIYSVSSRGNHAHVNGTHNYVFKIQTYALVCTLYLFLAQNSLVVCTILFSSNNSRPSINICFP